MRAVSIIVRLLALLLTLVFAGCTTAKREAAVLPPAPAAESQPALKTLHIFLQVPEGTGPVYLPGSLPELGPWNPGLLRMSGDGITREATLQVPAGTRIEYKFTLGSWDTEALTPEGNVPPNNVVLVNEDIEVHCNVARFRQGLDELLDSIGETGLLGTARIWKRVESATSILPRHVIVWLPPGYEDSGIRYPVLYMHDGQNLFDPRTCMTGVDWGVDECIVRLAEASEMPPVIVVAPFSTDERVREYSPWDKGPDYARFLIEELKPRVDREFRTMPDRENTAVMGSSMGGLISLYLAWKHPDVFGKAGCVSTHFPFDNGRIVSEIEEAGSFPEDVRLYFDYGSLPPDDEYGPFQDHLIALLKQWGRVEGREFHAQHFPGAAHNEQAWRDRLDTPMRFLFARQP